MAPEGRTLTRVSTTACVLGVAATLAALLLASRWAALSVFAGAAVAIGNFEALRRLGRRLVVPGRGKATVAIVLGAKVAVLFGLLYALVVVVKLDGVALAAGATALVVSIVFEGLRSSLASPGAEEA